MVDEDERNVEKAGTCVLDSFVASSACARSDICIGARAKGLSGLTSVSCAYSGYTRGPYAMSEAFAWLQSRY